MRLKRGSLDEGILRFSREQSRYFMQLKLLNFQRPVIHGVTHDSHRELCQLTFHNLFDSIIYCPSGSTSSWDCSSTRHTVNTSRGMAFQPLSWCIDHKSVASMNRNWWLMRNLLKLLLEIYDGAQVATKHSLVSFGCLCVAVWLATDWLVSKRLFHRRCQQLNCSPVDCLLNYCCSNCHSSRSLLPFAAVVPLCISFRWELKQSEREQT